MILWLPGSWGQEETKQTKCKLKQPQGCYANGGSCSSPPCHEPAWTRSELGAGTRGAPAKLASSPLGKSSLAALRQLSGPSLTPALQSDLGGAGAENQVHCPHFPRPPVLPLSQQTVLLSCCGPDIGSASRGSPQSADCCDGLITSIWEK